MMRPIAGIVEQRRVGFNLSMLLTRESKETEESEETKGMKYFIYLYL
ncbi:hypothetical protein KJ996_04190 [Patescibacteria group bacterium]|nr:hypothetical protein [Patescibacteria group bacterium]